MRDHRSSPALFWVRAIGALWLLTACGRGSDVATSLHSESHTGRLATTTSTSHLRESDDESDHAEHTGALTPARSAELGLQGPGRATPITEQLWSDPQAVAARFALVDTTYSASEDAAAVNARRAVYATPRLTADLATSSSGGARLGDLRRRQARFVGQIEALSSRERSSAVAVVELTVRVTPTTNDAPPESRMRFYRLTLGREAGTGRWLVARAEQS